MSNPFQQMPPETLNLLLGQSFAPPPADMFSGVIGNMLAHQLVGGIRAAESERIQGHAKPSLKEWLSTADHSSVTRLHRKLRQSGQLTDEQNRLFSDRLRALSTKR